MNLNIFGQASIALMFSAAALGSLTVSGPVMANAAQGTVKGAAPLCMAWNKKNGEFPLQPIVVPASDAKAMIKKDFAVIPCSDAFATFEDQLRWRDMICIITATSNDNVQDQLEVVIGERPAVLCGMAELALGQWTRSVALSADAAKQ